MENSEKRLTRKEASKYLISKGFQIKESTLAGFAHKGGGPMHEKFGNRAVYTIKELDKWTIGRLTPAN